MRITTSLRPLCLLAAVALLSSCVRPAAPLSRTEFVLGTSCAITLYDHPAQSTLDASFARLRDIDHRMSVMRRGASSMPSTMRQGCGPSR